MATRIFCTSGWPLFISLVLLVGCREKNPVHVTYGEPKTLTPLFTAGPDYEIFEHNGRYAIAKGTWISPPYQTCDEAKEAIASMARVDKWLRDQDDEGQLRRQLSWKKVDCDNTNLFVRMTYVPVEVDTNKPSKSSNTLSIVLDHPVGRMPHGEIQDNKAPDRILYRVANSYFRIGQQAALIAKDNARRDTNDVWGGMMMIDDPRILDVVKALHGSYLGLDTNSWVNTGDWIQLKD